MKISLNLLKIVDVRTIFSSYHKHWASMHNYIIKNKNWLSAYTYVTWESLLRNSPIYIHVCSCSRYIIISVDIVFNELLAEFPTDFINTTSALVQVVVATKWRDKSINKKIINKHCYTALTKALLCCEFHKMMLNSWVVLPFPSGWISVNPKLLKNSHFLRIPVKQATVKNRLT